MENRSYQYETRNPRAEMGKLIRFVIRSDWRKRYWKETGDTKPFDDQWKKSIELILQTFRQQQRKNDRGPYHFQRNTTNPTDTLPMSGYGFPVKNNWFNLLHVSAER